MYFLRRLSSRDFPIRVGETIGDLRLPFNRKQTIRKGDKIIVYSTSRIIGIYEITSNLQISQKGFNINQQTCENAFYFKSDAKYFFEAKLLTENYTKEWWCYQLTLQESIKMFQSKFPNKQVTFSGSLGCLKFGAEKISVTNDFGKFIQNRINI